MAARSLFSEYGTEIASALLLAALPQAYGPDRGSKVLAATDELNSNLSRRIAGTAQFLASVMTTASGSRSQKSKQPWRTGRSTPRSTTTKGRRAGFALRCACIHAAIRAKLSGSKRAVVRAGEVPLNQEDLLGMLLSFTVTVFEVLETYGIHWTADEQEAYLYLWDLVGAHLGIGSPYVVARLEQDYAKVVSDQINRSAGVCERHFETSRLGVRPRHTIASASWHGLRPPTLDDSRALLDQIQERQWPIRDPRRSALDGTELLPGHEGRPVAGALAPGRAREGDARVQPRLPLRIDATPQSGAGPQPLEPRRRWSRTGAGVQNLPKRRAIATVRSRRRP